MCGSGCAMGAPSTRAAHMPASCRRAPHGATACRTVRPTGPRGSAPRGRRRTAWGYRPPQPRSCRCAPRAQAPRRAPLGTRGSSEALCQRRGCECGRGPLMLLAGAGAHGGELRAQPVDTSAQPRVALQDAGGAAAAPHRPWQPTEVFGERRMHAGPRADDERQGWNIAARMRIRCVLPPPAGQHRDVSSPPSTLSTPSLWCHYRSGLLSVAEVSSGKRPLGHSRLCRRQAAQAASCSARSPQRAPAVLQLVLDGRVPHRHGLYQCADGARRR